MNLQSSKAAMDPLSELIALLKPRTYMSAAMDLGGEWSLQFCAYGMVKCYAMLSGSTWLVVDGEPAPILITAGDCFLLPSGRTFRIASDPALEPVDGLTILQVPVVDGVRTLQGGGKCFGLGAHFALSSDAGMLLGLLPPVVHLASQTDREAMRWALERMRMELREPKPGGALIARQLIDLLLVQALRLHMTNAPGDAVGWLFALSDKPLAQAIEAIHRAPGEPWTVSRLAERANMSRSAFAARFRIKAGLAPMEYLTRWRMLLAGDRLAHSSDSIAQIATQLGYDSVSSFSAAFKRVMGSAPRQFGAAARLGPPSDAPPGPEPVFELELQTAP